MQVFFNTASIFVVVLIIAILCMNITRTRSYNVLFLSCGILSCVMCIAYLILGAPDVAMTEAAINSALSTVITLSFFKHIISSNKATEEINDVTINDHTSMRKVLIAAGACVSICILYGAYLYKVVYLVSTSGFQTHAHAAEYYTLNTGREIGIPNLVTAVLASYRGFDTLGETSVILIAGIGVLMIMPYRNTCTDNTSQALQKNAILRRGSYFTLPLIGLYGFYIHFFGEVSPGGGFQAGAILASCFVCLDMLRSSNDNNTKFQGRYISSEILFKTAAVGVAIYITTGIIALLLHHNFLDYYAILDVLPSSWSHFIHAQSVMIFCVETGVLLTVMSVMVLMYNAMVCVQDIRLVVSVQPIDH